MRYLFRKTISISLLAAFILGLFSAAIPAGSVSAAAPTDETPPPPAGEEHAPGKLVIARLQRMYRVIHRRSDIQTRSLGRAEKFTKRSEEIIANLKEKGKDVTELENALAGFKIDLARATDAHETSQDILNTHAGFDEDGKVVDVDQARSTIKSAQENIHQCRITLHESTHKLREVIQKFREANPLPTEKAEQ